MRILSFLVCLSFTVLPAAAQPEPGAIVGRVTQAGLAAPMPGVNVTVAGHRWGTATRPDGAFRIEGVPAGTYTLRAGSIGFARTEHEVVVRAGETTRVDFELAEQPIEIAEIVVERVTLTGGRQGVSDLPGAAHYLGPEELERFSFNDAARVLRAVPGVYLQEEDGYGLRPNIGMRGTGVERSSKITVMEDGVLIAPAPYAAPAAYYFPTVGRMQAVEVRKGSSQIKYGPYTTGGALNLISTQIPFEFAGHAELLAGAYEDRTAHVWVGNAHERVGYLFETYQARSGGFKELDGGGSTGFDVRDYVGKLRFTTRPGARVPQTLTLKASQTTHTSDETYLGLAAADFARTPYRRYAGSRQDVMDTDHRLLQARHVVRPSASLDLTTTLYRTDFARNWYKLDRVRASEDGSRIRIASLLADPAAYPEAFGIVTGTTSPNDNALEVKANNREYFAQGVQSVLGWRAERGAARHEVELGVRYHLDQIDRFQWVDLYRMDEGRMRRTAAGTPGTESNRVEEAEAVAAFAQYRLDLGRLSVLPGLRYENILTTRDDYGKSDPARAGADLSSRQNRVDVWIPGLGLAYDLTGDLKGFVGVHRGFSPAGSKEGVEPEWSIDYEAGLRFRRGLAHAEAIGFYNDYANLLGADLTAAGGQGTGDPFNGGEAEVYGVELSGGLNAGPLAAWRVSLPLTASYTYTHATFSTDFESEFDAWGTVVAGDELPYLPQHQLALGLGVEGARYGVHLSTKYTGRMRTVAGQEAFTDANSLDGHLVVDLAGEYGITRHVRAFGSIRNLTDEVYVAASRPAGLRPGMPRLLLLGLKVDL